MGIKSIRDIGTQAISQETKRPKESAGEARKSEFRTQLENSLSNVSKLKFSGHALDRLADRGVVMTEDKTERLLKAVDAAQNKGSRDSLVLLDELAFVVSVKNRTVVTACETGSLKEGVFTKIDSAVLG
jgi:flagellar operon protein